MPQFGGRAKMAATASIATVSIAVLAVAMNLGPVRHLSGEQQQLLDEARATFEGAWLATSPDAGGYTLSSSSVPSSLYATSWTIQLLRRADAIPDTLEPSSVGDLMHEAIDHPEGHGVPPLEAIWLALQTLDALGLEPPAKTVGSILPRYITSRGLYSYELGGEPSWGATSVAAKVMTLVGEPPTGATVEAIRDALDGSSTPETIEEIVNHHIPMWEAADALLPIAERAAFKSKVDAILAYFEHWIGDNGSYGGGPILGAVVSLRDIASRNSSGPLVVDLPALWLALGTPNGGLGAGPGAPVPDPHTTYDALRLGAVLDPLGRTYFTSRARSDGWPGDLIELDPCNTYMGAAVNKAAGEHSHDRALSATAQQWLSQLNTAPEAGKAALCVLALAVTVGVGLPPSVVEKMQTAASESTSGISGPPPSLSLRILRIVGLPGPLAPVLGNEKPGPDIDEVAAYDACIAYADLMGRDGDCALAQDLRAADGTYKRSRDAPVSDLEATAIALQHNPDLSARMAALSRFRADGNTWMVPAHMTPNVSNLYSAFLGLVLADVIRDPRYL